MRPHPAASLALASIAASGVCAAAPEPCSGPKLALLVPAGSKWQHAAAELGEWLRTLKDLDPCARVSVQPSGGDVTLEIVTGDGRRATRHIVSVPELLRTAEALLVLPPEPSAAASSAPASSAPASSAPASSAPASSAPASSATVPAISSAELPPSEVSSPEHRSPRTRVASSQTQFGVGGSLRFGGGPFYAGGGALGFAQFVQGDWLLEVSARWDAADAIVAEPTPRDFYMTSGAFGFSAGRRFAVGSARVDALLGPNLVLEIQDADDMNREVHEATTDFRISFALRASGAPSASLQPFVGSDVEASPARARSPRSLDSSLPSLPWWSAGFTVGALWGTP